jgi:hypothetical protein
LIQSRAATIPCVPVVCGEHELRVPKAASVWIDCVIRSAEMVAKIERMSESLAAGAADDGPAPGVEPPSEVDEPLGVEPPSEVDTPLGVEPPSEVDEPPGADPPPEVDTPPAVDPPPAEVEPP